MIIALRHRAISQSGRRLSWGSPIDTGVTSPARLMQEPSAMWMYASSPRDMSSPLQPFSAAPVGWPTCASASRHSRRRRCWRDVYMIPGEQGGGRRKRCMLCYYRQYGGHRGQANAKTVGILFSMDTWSRCRVNARLILAFLGVVKPSRVTDISLY